MEARSEPTQKSIIYNWSPVWLASNPSLYEVSTGQLPPPKFIRMNSYGYHSNPSTPNAEIYSVIHLHLDMSNFKKKAIEHKHIFWVKGTVQLVFILTNSSQTKQINLLFNFT